MTPTEPTRWKSPYLDAADYEWNRQYDAKMGVREAIRGILINAAVASPRSYRDVAGDLIECVLGAVVPERRAVLAGTIVDAFGAWWDVRQAGGDQAALREAHRPFGRLLDEAAFAQLAGIRFLYAGSAA